MTAFAPARLGVGLALLVAAASPAAAQGPALLIWHLERGIVRVPRGAPTGPLPVGSLTKPFVARAWARVHPAERPPVLECTRDSGCWLPTGHGTVGLARAIAVSCNAYFRTLASATPPREIAEAFTAAGLLSPSPLTVEGAIGLPTPEGAVSARPETLLRSYAALVHEPWSEGDAVRRAIVAGLRDAAREGTARAFDGHGVCAKTGTVPAVDGRALSTSGWALTVEDSGGARLALLLHGTGREAAAALAANPAGVATARTPEADRSHRRVRVSLFGALRPRQVAARNAGLSPARTSRGFVGPGATLTLGPGDRLDDGLWELRLPGPGLRRLIRGVVVTGAGPGDTLRLRAEVTPAEYVAGVLLAELPGGDEAARVALGATILRFLSPGSRHGSVDVCDRTHCAWFVGRGPRVTWVTPGKAVLAAAPEGTPRGPALSEDTWRRIVAAAREPGPRYWTSHCGGAPLSPGFVWGGDSSPARACPRHGPSDADRWTRHWSRAEVDRALGPAVALLQVTDEAGRWSLRVVGRDGPRLLSWDDAHARLATVLGWDALPSPADRIEPDGDGFRAEGRGRGHRVGLCLAALAALD